jgi:hypothetical protein
VRISLTSSCACQAFGALPEPDALYPWLVASGETQRPQPPSPVSSCGCMVHSVELGVRVREGRARRGNNPEIDVEDVGSARVPFLECERSLHTLARTHMVATAGHKCTADLSSLAWKSNWTLIALPPGCGTLSDRCPSFSPRVCFCMYTYAGKRERLVSMTPMWLPVPSCESYQSTRSCSNKQQVHKVLYSQQST